VAARGGSAADAPQTHATMSTTGTGRRAGAGCCCCCWGRTVAAWFLLTTVISTLNELGRCFFGVARLGEIAAGLCPGEDMLQKYFNFTWNVQFYVHKWN